LPDGRRPGEANHAVALRRCDCQSRPFFYPVKNVTTGLELQWGRRQNFSDGFGVNDFRVQFQAKYNFSFDLGAEK
jgi:hypothetical protein